MKFLIILFSFLLMLSCKNKESSVEVGNETLLIDSRDNNSYKIGAVGTSTWMLENLKYADKDAANLCESPVDSCDTYGNYYRTDKSEGICPEGWRLPTTVDLNELIAGLDGENFIERGGKKVAAAQLDFLNVQWGGYAKMKGSIDYRTREYMAIYGSTSDT